MKNFVEELVAREYERLRPDVEDFCGCKRCRADVITYALNRLPPHYAARLRGEVITSIELESDQGKSDVAVVLLDAFQVVKQQPSEGCKRMPPKG